MSIIALKPPWIMWDHLPSKRAWARWMLPLEIDFGGAGDEAVTMVVTVVVTVAVVVLGPVITPGYGGVGGEIMYLY